MKSTVIQSLSEQAFPSSVVLLLIYCRLPGSFSKPERSSLRLPHLQHCTTHTYLGQASTIFQRRRQYALHVLKDLCRDVIVRRFMLLSPLCKCLRISRHVQLLVSYAMVQISSSFLWVSSLSSLTFFLFLYIFPFMSLNSLNISFYFP